MQDDELKGTDCASILAAAASNLDMIKATREKLHDLQARYLRSAKIKSEHIAPIDCFYYILNADYFSQWSQLSWWKQRVKLQELREDGFYLERVDRLLEKSFFRKYYAYSDKMVRDSGNPAVKFAWNRKRLARKEAYWNALDSISHAAYFQKKYDGMYPGILVSLSALRTETGAINEILLIVDNGVGRKFKKKSKDTGSLWFLYRLWKILQPKGVYYIGGMKLGLESISCELHCQGDGAVVRQNSLLIIG